MSHQSQPFRHVGLAIKLLRTRASLTQRGLAGLARITKAQASKYERGVQRPTLDSLDRVMVALGVDVFDLAAAIQEVEHATEALHEEEADLPEAERRRSDRRRARDELVRGFSRYLELLEESLERSDADSG
jgi:transcriptional regulator with XRE-family HTH domain